MSQLPKQTSSLSSKKVSAAQPAPKLSRRERFRKHAERRVSNAIRAINNVGRMGNRQLYEYTADEANKIMEELASALARCRGTYQEKAKAPGFQLF